MEKINLGEGIWIDCLSQKVEFGDTQRPTTIDGAKFIMCKHEHYIYLVRVEGK